MKIYHSGIMIGTCAFRGSILAVSSFVNIILLHLHMRVTMYDSPGTSCSNTGSIKECPLLDL
jgi:hypothetical protein